MLKYLPDAVWNRLPLPDFRARFFVECFIEKLRMYTPHFYQARLMNVFSASAEMMVYLAEYRENDKNGAYVVSSIEEINDCWDADPVAQEVLGDLIVLRAPLTKSIQSGELTENVLSRISTLCRAILARRESYVGLLLEAVRRDVLGPADLSQKERVTSQIDRLVGLYTTHLLNEGYSPTYLFNRADLFTRDNNYRGRTFLEQFDVVTDRLNNKQVEFEVCYGIHTTKPSFLLGIRDEPNLEFLDTIPTDIQGTDLEKFKKNIDISVVVRSRITSTDYVSAALRTKERVDRFLDAATALEVGAELQVSAHCVTMTRGQATHTRTLNVDVLLAFMSKEAGSGFSTSEQTIRQAFARLDDEAKDQLGRSLRYLRLARHSVSLEQKLLNLWIALESLFVCRETPILANILDYVPQLYATSSLARRVWYLHELLTQNQVRTTSLFQEKILAGVDVFDARVSDEHVFALLRNEQVAIELFNSLGGLEHLKFKMMQIFKDLKDNRAIVARLQKSEGDVRRQLRRIYFLRNKIAHTGHFSGVRPQLVTHLLDYLAICYRAISSATAKAPAQNRYSIPELLAAGRMGADLVSSRASARDEIRELAAITVSPVV